VGFEAGERTLGRLASTEITIPYAWIEGEAYEIFLLSSTGATFTTTIDSAAETPEADGGFFGLMALLGVYVGVIPVALGMLWLPFVRRIDQRWVRFLLALTVGLLAFLGLDAIAEGVEVAAAGPQAFGGPVLVFAGALVAYLALAAIDAEMTARRGRAAAAGITGFGLALLIAIGIGLHNLGEGLAIGSSYATGALALGAFLVVGFAIHNTTEGLAIVAPLSGRAPGLGRLAALGVIAGAPAIVGAVIGAVAFDPSLSAFLLGVGAGAIAQVIVQIAPSIRDRSGRALNPLTVCGLIAGIALMYVTGLLVAV
jgi:zinc transporter ZupT